MMQRSLICDSFQSRRGVAHPPLRRFDEHEESSRQSLAAEIVLPRNHRDSRDFTLKRS